jgi:hypothetical protein
MKVAFRMPRRICYWCAIRVGAAATVGEHSDQIVPDLLYTEALIRWDLGNPSHLRSLRKCRSRDSVENG